jgi:hypothetical protein
MFSVVVRAQSLDLKPCDDSRLNYLMSFIRVGIGGLAGSLLVLLLTPVLPHGLQSAGGARPPNVDQPAILQMIFLIGFIAGFAERLVPNLVRATASKLDTRAGTPGEALIRDESLK